VAKCFTASATLRSVAQLTGPTLLTPVSTVLPSSTSDARVAS
jgi:hypothetical protein